MYVAKATTWLRSEGTLWSKLLINTDVMGEEFLGAVSMVRPPTIVPVAGRLCRGVLFRFNYLGGYIVEKG